MFISKLTGHIWAQFAHANLFGTTDFFTNMAVTSTRSIVLDAMLYFGVHREQLHQKSFRGFTRLVQISVLSMTTATLHFIRQPREVTHRHANGW